MLAGWLRLKFPHLVHAAVASSAPVRIVVEMSECGRALVQPRIPLSLSHASRRYNDAVAAAFAVEHEEVGGSAACESLIRRGHQDVLRLMSDAAGRQRLASLFGRSPDWCATAG